MSIATRQRTAEHASCVRHLVGRFALSAAPALAMAWFGCGGNSSQGNDKAGNGGSEVSATSSGGQAAAEGGSESLGGATESVQGGQPQDTGQGGTAGTAATAAQTSGGSAPVGGGAGGPNGDAGRSPADGGLPPLAQLGAACTVSGGLACSNASSKSGLLCSDGTWKTNVTCSGNQFCDVQTGACQDPDPSCSNKGPGDKFCRDGAFYQCVENELSIRLEACQLGCDAKGCRRTEDCPNGTVDEDWVNCANDCGGPSKKCASICARPDIPAPSGTATIWRMPSAADACTCTNLSTNTRGYRRIFTLPKTDSWLRLRVEAPWGVIRMESVFETCAYSGAYRCHEVEADREVEIAVTTDDPFAPARNLLIEKITEPTNCK